VTVLVVETPLTVLARIDLSPLNEGLRSDDLAYVVGGVNGVRKSVATTPPDRRRGVSGSQMSFSGPGEEATESDCVGDSIKGLPRS
jgi:excinuclease UvrABC ATPase subunit